MSFLELRVRAEWRKEGSEAGGTKLRLERGFREGFLEAASVKLGFEGCVGVCQEEGQTVSLKIQMWESIRGRWVTRVGWRGGDTCRETGNEAEVSRRQVCACPGGDGEPREVLEQGSSCLDLGLRKAPEETRLGSKAWRPEE